MPITPAWTDIPDSDVDPDSPCTTGLFTALRDNPDFLSQWIGTRATAVANHAHQGLATDGTAPVDYSDISNTPTALCKGFVNAQSVTVTAGGGDGEYDSGSLGTGFTPALCNSTIMASTLTGTTYTDYYCWGVAIGTGGTDSYFIGEKAHISPGLTSAELLTGTGMVGKAYSDQSSSDMNITVSQFSNAGIKFVLPDDGAMSGQTIIYKVCISVTGY